MNQPDAIQLEFRNAMASLAAAVNIVTTAGPGGAGGITVSAVCSVTDSPPTVLVCVNRNSGMHKVFRENGRVAVNVLSEAQAQMALHFAGVTKIPMEERLAWDDWSMENGVPVLRDAVVQLIGTIDQDIEMGSHSVFFVKIESITTRAERNGLAYFRRSFHPVVVADSPVVEDWQFYDEWADPGMASIRHTLEFDESFVTGTIRLP